MSDELLISVLKEYVPFSDYDLHDWDSIVERGVEVTKGIYKYSLVYADIYLTYDLEFYDAEPKQPIHLNFLNNDLSEDLEFEKNILDNYHNPFCDVEVDWTTVIGRKEEVKEGVYKYSYRDMDLYFDDELIPVEMGRVHISDNIVLYNFTPEGSTGAGTYVPIGEII